MACSIIGVVISGCLAMSPRPTGQEAAATFAQAPHVEPAPIQFKVPEGWTLVGSIRGEVRGSWWPYGVHQNYGHIYGFDRAYVGDGMWIGTGFGNGFGLHERTGARDRRLGRRSGY